MNLLLINRARLQPAIPMTSTRWRQWHIEMHIDIYSCPTN